MLTGGCLCGGVRFEITGEIGSPSFCHCLQCRRASGSAFATNAGISAADFHLRAGADLVREYESSPGQFRAFCSRCGSPVYSRRRDHPELFTITDGLPQLERGDA
ncbi:MAG: GFA family protein [Deltaproteobacteria bacterium]|nr:MAG: GFA family protein [Deltaproteobacteria bacterium]